MNNTNKGKIMMGVIVLSLIIISLRVFGATSTTVGRTQLYFYNVDTTMINYEPDPAEAGRYVTVRFKIENSGAENAEGITVELLPKYPFSLDPGESAVKDIGSVRPGQIGDTGVIVDYRLKVDENALEGANEIELRYKVRDNDWIRLEPFDIEVKPHDILLSIESVDAPEMIKPGEVSRVGINLKNIALSFIKEIKVTLNLDGIPFATIGSTNRKIIKQMDAGSEGVVSFDIVAEPDADSDLYKLPIEIEFLDRLGNMYTKNETAGIVVGAKPDLSVNIDATEVYSGGGLGEVAIKFVNKGLTDVKFLNIILKESNDYTLLSPQEVYVGNIDSDDYETAEFKLAIKKTDKKEIMLPLDIEYKDANNNEYKREAGLKLKLYSAKEAKAMGFNKGNGVVGISIVIAIVAGGFFVYRGWKEKRSKKAGEGFKLNLPFFRK